MSAPLGSRQSQCPLQESTQLILADFPPFGNLAIGLLMTLSISTWSLIGVRWAQGQPAIPARPREPNSWRPGAGFRAFVAAFAIPSLLVLAIRTGFGATSLGPTVLGIVTLCLASSVQILVAAGM